MLSVSLDDTARAIERVSTLAVATSVPWALAQHNTVMAMFSFTENKLT